QSGPVMPVPSKTRHRTGVHDTNPSASDTRVSMAIRSAFAGLLPTPLATVRPGAGRRARRGRDAGLAGAGTPGSPGRDAGLAGTAGPGRVLRRSAPHRPH